MCPKELRKCFKNISHLNFKKFFQNFSNPNSIYNFTLGLSNQCPSLFLLARYAYLFDIIYALAEYCYAASFYFLCKQIKIKLNFSPPGLIYHHLISYGLKMPLNSYTILCSVEID